MNYCSHCGSDQLDYSIPEDDHRPRYICQKCHTIHYQNPNMVVGCIVEHKGKVLLAKRGIEPRKGFWNLPCGFLENEETVEEGAQREVQEETGAKVKLGHLHAVYNLPHAQQVYLIFTSSWVSGELVTTPESTEVAFFAPEEIPWKEIAFSSNSFALHKYFTEDLSQRQTFLGTFRKHKTDGA